LARSAATSCATHAALVGYVGAAAFEDEPLIGVLFGLGLAACVAGVIELVGAHAGGNAARVRLA
jgi:membrane-associated protein